MVLSFSNGFLIIGAHDNKSGSILSFAKLTPLLFSVIFFVLLVFAITVQVHKFHNKFLMFGLYKTNLQPLDFLLYKQAYYQQV